jgi:hypothetical protein
MTVKAFIKSEEKKRSKGKDQTASQPQNSIPPEVATSEPPQQAPSSDPTPTDVTHDAAGDVELENTNTYATPKNEVGVVETDTTDAVWHTSTSDFEAVH